MCMCVCACVREREREGAREGKREEAIILTQGNGI